MYPHDQTPVHSNPDRHQYGRRHSARYYMRRVQESLTARISKLICGIFLTLLFIMGVVTFILWLSLRPHRPRFHIRDFSISGLSQPNGFENAQVTFNVTSRNSNQNIEIHYDAMQVNLYYQDQSIGSTGSGAPFSGPFLQEPKNTTVLYGVLSGAMLTLNNQLWTQFQGDLAHGAVIFRLEVTSTIRFKVSTWESKRHWMHDNCVVGVGPDGSILASYRDKKCPVYFT